MLRRKIMSLNDTPSGERIHIGFFGRRNVGKSSLVNAVTGQELAVVSDTKGTTTDPVSKAMELLPLGPVMIIDTPGFDDEGALGQLRVKKTRQVLNRTDVAVLVADINEGLKNCDRELIALFNEKEIPFIIAWNKCDLKDNPVTPGKNEICVSALNKTNIYELKELIANIGKVSEDKFMLCADLLHPCDIAVLVIPIDKAAPKGRLILPQQQVIRDVLEADAAAVCVKEFELKDLLESLVKPPALVITDSQVFAKASADTPPEIPLTSFSILMARKKGLLNLAVKGVTALESLNDGDSVLIAEGCTHHRQCDDIGTVKIPRWIKQYTGKKLKFESTSGRDFPDDLSEYSLILHCGGCMLNEREVRYRMKCAKDAGIPVTNYGICIAYMQGILKRSVSVFPHLAQELE